MWDVGWLFVLQGSNCTVISRLKIINKPTYKKERAKAADLYDISCST